MSAVSDLRSCSRIDGAVQFALSAKIKPVETDRRRCPIYELDLGHEDAFGGLEPRLARAPRLGRLIRELVEQRTGLRSCQVGSA